MLYLVHQSFAGTASTEFYLRIEMSRALKSILSASALLSITQIRVGTHCDSIILDQPQISFENKLLGISGLRV